MTVVTNVGLKSSRVNRFTITVLTSKIQSKFFKEFDRKLKEVKQRLMLVLKIIYYK